MAVIATITYNGTLLAGQIRTGPWQIIMANFPDYGWVPTAPQFAMETLQPENVDGARYRIGGSHWPMFTMLGITAAAEFDSARVIARDMERINGQPIIFQAASNFGTVEPQILLQVISVKARANPGRPLGASVGPVGGINGPPGGGAVPAGGALASVDSVWTCQVYLP